MRDFLESLQQEWQDELRTNEHGLADLAERAIAVLKEQIKQCEPQGDASK